MPDKAPAALTVTFATLEALPAWLAINDQPLIVMPFIDMHLARRAARQLSRQAGAAGHLLCVYDTQRVGFIAVCNLLFRASSAPFFGYIAQDAFGGRGWLHHALAELTSTKTTARRSKDGGLLAFNDGKWGGALAAFGLVDRRWALTNYDGDLFHPSYRAHYADVELTLIAMQQGKLRFDPLAMVIEVDWQKEARVVTEEDRLTYYKRGQTAFDRKVPNAELRRLFK